jgi:N-acyl homoserine lactone hydrolase
MRLYLFQMAILPTNGIPAVSYLIQTDDGANVLIDTGFPKNSEAPRLAGAMLGIGN